MRNKNLIIILMVLVIALLFVLYKFSFTGYVINNPHDVTIGFIGPLTGFGAAWGLEQQNAIEMALDEIDNKNLKIIYEDTKCDGKEAVSAAQKLININKVKILMPVCSSETLAVAPIAEKNKILVLGVWPTNSEVSNAGDYIFRVSYSDEDTSKIMAKTLNKYDKIGIISEQTDYAIGIKNGFEKYYNGIIIEEDYAHNSKDIRTQITKILSKNPEAVLINPDSPATGLEVLEQLHNLGFRGDLYGNFFGGSGEVINSEYSQGMIFFSDPTPKGSIKEKLLSEYIRRYGKKPDFEFAVAAQYDAIFILDKAINECGNSPDCIRDFLYDIDSFSGALGIYYFDENGDIVGIKPSVKQIVDKEVVEIIS